MFNLTVHFFPCSCVFVKNSLKYLVKNSEKLKYLMQTDIDTLLLVCTMKKSFAKYFVEIQHFVLTETNNSLFTSLFSSSIPFYNIFNIINRILKSIKFAYFLPGYLKLQNLVIFGK